MAAYSQLDPDQWLQSDAVSLRQFLGDNPKLMRVLAKRRPKIEGSTMESRAVTGSEAAGFIKAVEEIEALCLDVTRSTEEAGFVEDSVDS